MVANSRILLIGAGNLATSLGVALAAAGIPPVAVWSRTHSSAQELGDRIGCPSSCSFDDLPAADIVIISVADSALPSVAQAVARRYPAALMVHTAGSVPVDVLRSAGAGKYGVFYPMQTFSKQRIADFSKITTFVEGSSEGVAACLEELAARIGSKAVRATGEQRKYLHIAAVFACNFTNAAYSMAAELLEANGLPFEAMLPLVEETAEKVHHLHPADAQTGPARRGDENVMNVHKAMLAGRLKEVYSIMSDYITAKTKKTDNYDKLRFNQDKGSRL